MRNQAQPIAIAVAPNGGRKTKTDHPALPLTPAELARTAAECVDAGASMIHVHVRNAEGKHLLDAAAYREAIAAIGAAVSHRLVVQITTEALGLYTPAEQVAVVKETRPEAVSLALKEFVRGAADEPAFASFLEWVKRERILPQIILYSPEEAVHLAELSRRGVVPWDDVPVLYVLGRYTPGQVSAPADLLPFLAPTIPCFTHWSVCAFGRREAACVIAGALLGGHVRTGFENNTFLPDGSLASSNAHLVTAVKGIMDRAGCSSATAEDLRTMWSCLG